MRRIDWELRDLEQALADGKISKHGADIEYANIMSSYEAEAERAAEDAYDREMEDRGFGRR